jgi:hypothetical protein
MTKGNSLSIITAAMIVGLGAAQAFAAPGHSSPGHAAAGFGAHNPPRGAAGDVGVTGDNYWIRPDCLQRNVLVQTSRGLVWEPKAQCTY